MSAKRTCHGKRRYRDQDEALRSARSIAARVRRGEGHRGKNGAQPNRAYECHRCNGWHLTSQPQR